jgi:hypothetical protein
MSMVYVLLVVVETVVIVVVAGVCCCVVQCSICAEAQRRSTVGHARIVHYVMVQLGTHDIA